MVRRARPRPLRRLAGLTALPESAEPGEPAWARWFGAYDRLVLVANSEAVSRAALEAMPEGTLFVFFNRVFKVLDAPFARPSVLVARCSIAGPNVVHRNEQGSVLGLLAGDAFHGVLQLRAAPHEAFGEAAAFAPHPVARLDLSGWFDGVYPPGDVPTSGFALAAWMMAFEAAPPVTLAGFSAERSDRWKLFDDHDWAFEQVVLRSLASGGRLERVPAAGEAWPLGAMMDRLGAAAPDPAVVAAVLSERQRGTNVMLDRVWSMMKPIRTLDRAFRRLKPPTRKERAARARTGGER